MLDAVIKMLEGKGVKPTPMRMLVLEQMLAHGEGVSLNEMERLLIDSDRITIYRTLRTFERHGIVHSLDLVNRGTVFALCDDCCSPGGHADRHPHFFCTSCGKIDCSGDFTFELTEAPASRSYRVDNVEVVIKGICPSCLSRKP